MTKSEIGAAIFEEIKAHVEKQGYGMSNLQFPESYPVSRRTCYHIKAGRWTPELLAKLPFKVTVNYKIEFHT